MADFGANQLVPHFNIDYLSTEYSNLGQGGDGNFFRFGTQSSLYNLADAGNFLWGAWMATNGFSRDLTTWGANQNSQLSGYGPDTVADQRAIRNGFNYINQIMRN